MLTLNKYIHITKYRTRKYFLSFFFSLFFLRNQSNGWTYSPYDLPMRVLNPLAVVMRYASLR